MTTLGSTSTRSRTFVPRARLILVILVLIGYIFYVTFLDVTLDEQSPMAPQEDAKILKTSSLKTRWIEQRKMKIVILSEARSGSSFLGDLVQQMRPNQTYYSFEPFIGMPSRLYVSFLDDLLACRFQTIKEATNHLRPIFWKIQYFRWNRLLRSEVERKTKKTTKTRLESKLLWFDPVAHQRLCDKAQVLLLKTIRLTMQQFLVARSGLETDQDAVKLIYLVRDPRAVMTSRYKLSWCYNTPNCTEPATLCTKMAANLAILEKLRLGQVILVRHEDLLYNVTEVVDKLANYLGLVPFDTALTSWLDRHTHSDDLLGDPHSTYRNVAILPWAWRTEVSPDDVVDIEAKCGEVMQKLGYRTLKSEGGEAENGDPEDRLLEFSYPLEKFSILHQRV